MSTWSVSSAMQPAKRIASTWVSALSSSAGRPRPPSAPFSRPTPDGASRPPFSASQKGATNAPRPPSSSSHQQRPGGSSGGFRPPTPRPGAQSGPSSGGQWRAPSHQGRPSSGGGQNRPHGGHRPAHHQGGSRPFAKPPGQAEGGITARSFMPTRAPSARVVAQQKKEAALHDARMARRAAAELVDDGRDDAWRVLEDRDRGDDEDDTSDEAHKAEEHDKNGGRDLSRRRESTPAATAPPTKSPPSQAAKNHVALRNDEITSPEVLLVMDDGEKRGTVSLAEALSAAAEKGMDLLQVATSPIVVCRVVPKPGAPKKAAVATSGTGTKANVDNDSASDDDDDDEDSDDDVRPNRKNMKKPKVAQQKRLQFKITMASHDFDTKIKRANTFLTKGVRVQCDIPKRMALRHLVDEDYMKFAKSIAERLSEVAIVEREPRLTGNAYALSFGPRKQPKA